MGVVPLNVIEGDMVVLPSCRRVSDDALVGWASMAGVLFANFDGVDVRPGDTSLENEGLRELDKQDPIEVARYAVGTTSKRLSNILRSRRLVAGWYGLQPGRRDQPSAKR